MTLIFPLDTSKAEPGSQLVQISMAPGKVICGH